MMDAVIAAGERLAEALRAENEALAALDLTRAAAMATRTQARAEGPLRAAAESLAKNLSSLGQENRNLLETAIELQSRVIETIAGAARPLTAAPGYGRAGKSRPAVQAAAMALATRV